MLGKILIISAVAPMTAAVVLILAAAEFDRTKSPGADRLGAWGERFAYLAVALVLVGMFC